MAAAPRRQYCGKLHVILPQKVRCKPPLRQAAGTLSASGETVRCKRIETRKLEVSKPTKNESNSL